MARCRCGGAWSGVVKAHCGACHVTFDTAVLFDRHRVGTPAGRQCLPPSERIYRKEELPLPDLA